MRRMIASTLSRLSRYLLVGRLLRLYIKALRPISPPLFYKIASKSYRFHSKNTVATGIAQRGVDRFPLNTPLRIEFADSLLQSNEFQRASYEYDYLIQETDAAGTESVWLKLSRSYQLQNKHHAAQFVLLRASSLFPRNDNILLATAKNAYYIQDWQVASSGWDKLLQLGVTLPPKETLWAARSFHKTRDIKRAKKLLKQVFSDSSHGVEALVEYALIQSEEKKYTEAIQSWREAKDRQTDTLALSLARTIDFNISLISRILSPVQYKKQLATYKKITSKKQPKIVVYTSYTKGYDVLKPHAFIDSRFDYVVFTDDKPGDYGLYDIRDLPTDHVDGRVSTRYPKTHPHILFPDYDVAIWLDASIMVIDDIYPAIESFLASGKAIGTTPHTHRESLFEEIVVCMERNKDSYDNLKLLYDFFEHEKFDQDNLSENGFLLFRPKHPNLGPALELWWDMILKYSKRDQLSFGYALNRSKLEWYRISEPPQNINNNPAFIITSHNQRLDIIHDLEAELT